MNITDDNQQAIFELLYKYWVDQESYPNLEQEISYIDPQDIGYYDNSIEAIDIADEITNTDPVLFEDDLAQKWQKFVHNRLSGLE